MDFEIEKNRKNNSKQFCRANLNVYVFSVRLKLYKYTIRTLLFEDCLFLLFTTVLLVSLGHVAVDMDETVLAASKPQTFEVLSKKKTKKNYKLSQNRNFRSDFEDIMFDCSVLV